MTKLDRSHHVDGDANPNRGQLDDDLPTSTPCEPRVPDDEDGRRTRPPPSVRWGGKENQETVDELPDAHDVGSKRGG